MRIRSVIRGISTAVPCDEVDRCQICQFAFSEQNKHPPKMFVATTYSAEVNMVTYDDVISGQAKVPFTERPAWISAQEEDQIHSILRDLVSSEQKPEKKQTNKHYTAIKRIPHKFI